MQIGPGFRIRTSIDKVAGNGVEIILTDDGCHVCISYHLKGVCNMHLWKSELA